MAATDLNQFLHSLNSFIVAAAAAQTPAVTLSCFAEPINLFRNKSVIGAGSPDPCSVMRIYGGPPRQMNPAPVIAVQCETIGTGEEATLQRAQAIYECLLQPSNGKQPGLPLRMVTITGYSNVDNSSDGEWLIIAVDPKQPPGKIGVDSSDRPRIVFNFDVEFTRLTVTEEI